ncbi:Ig-like domain-containing protein, partial [Plesiomonas shigelloides]|uniref:Ig-like domain-containing protein n=1 Tax=Plesiomonas shigelloides TaxID=703 RepID=UPI00387F057D
MAQGRYAVSVKKGLLLISGEKQQQVAEGATAYLTTGQKFTVATGSQVLLIDGKNLTLLNAGDSVDIGTQGIVTTQATDATTQNSEGVEPDADIAAIQKALKAGLDVTETAPAPAAGNASAQQSAGGDGGATGGSALGATYRIDYSGQQTRVTAGYDTSGQTNREPTRLDLGATGSNALPEPDENAADKTAPFVTVDAPDNTNDTMPTISGKTDAPAGSTVTIVVTDAKGDTQTLTTTVRPDGSYSVDVTKPLAEGGYQADASVSDPAGNKGQASDSGNVDVIAPKITVDTPVSTQDTTPTITGKTDAPAGSTVSIVVTDAKGDKQTLTTTVKPDGSYSVDVTKPLAEGGYQADASVSDPAGNKGQASDSGNVDVAAPAPTVELQGADSDDTYNKAEVGSDNSVTAKVTLSAGTLVGDLLVVKDGAGKELFNGKVTAEMLKDGLTVEVPVGDKASDVKVTAQVTDQAGNASSEAQDTAGVDNVEPTVGNTTISYAENQTANAVLGNIGAADDKGVAGIVFKATGTNVSADGYYQIN